MGWITVIFTATGATVASIGTVVLLGPVGVVIVANTAVAGGIVGNVVGNKAETLLTVSYCYISMHSLSLYKQTWII